MGSFEEWYENSVAPIGQEDFKVAVEWYEDPVAPDGQEDFEVAVETRAMVSLFVVEVDSVVVEEKLSCQEGA